MIFRDRIEAGHKLAENLRDYAGRDDVLVLALPRGGVPVGYAVAHALGAPLDVFLVRKLGVPGQEELAMGAVASGDVRVLNSEIVRELGISPEVIDRVAALESRELERRDRLYRGDRPRPDLAGKSLPLVKAPTLLIVGGDDVPVIGMNQEAYDQMSCVRRMEIVPRATHLFEEPGALEEVARLAGDWFVKYLK